MPYRYQYCYRPYGEGRKIHNDIRIAIDAEPNARTVPAGIPMALTEGEDMPEGFELVTRRAIEKAYGVRFCKDLREIAAERTAHRDAVDCDNLQKSGAV